MMTTVPTGSPHGQPATGKQSSRRRVRWGLAALLLLAGPAAYADYVVEAGAYMDEGGTVLLSCDHALTIAGELDLTGPGIFDPNDTTINGGGLLDGGSGILRVGGDWTNQGIFNPGASTVQLTGACTGGAPVVLTGQTSFCHLDLSGAGITYVIPAGQNITVNRSLTLGNNTQLVSSGPARAYITLGSGATISGSYTSSTVQITQNGLPSTAPIPTLGEYGLIALILLLGGIVARRGRFRSCLKNKPLIL